MAATADQVVTVRRVAVTCPHCGRIQMVAALSGLAAGQAVIQIKCSRQRCGALLTIDLSDPPTNHEDDAS